MTRRCPRRGQGDHLHAARASCAHVVVAAAAAAELNLQDVEKLSEEAVQEVVMLGKEDPEQPACAPMHKPNTGFFCNQHPKKLERTDWWKGQDTEAPFGAHTLVPGDVQDATWRHSSEREPGRRS